MRTRPINTPFLPFPFPSSNCLCLRVCACVCANLFDSFVLLPRGPLQPFFAHHEGRFPASCCGWCPGAPLQQTGGRAAGENARARVQRHHSGKSLHLQSQECQTGICTVPATQHITQGQGVSACACVRCVCVRCACACVRVNTSPTTTTTTTISFPCTFMRIPCE